MSPRPEKYTRQDILDTALALVDSLGLEQLTMRKLGSTLGADPMTAYRHFSSKADLAAALADMFWGSLTLPDADGLADWHAYATQLMRTIRAELAAHSGLIPIVSTHQIESPASLAVVDEAVGVMLDLGAPAHPTLGDLLNTLVMVTVASATGEYSAPAGTDQSASGNENRQGDAAVRAEAGHDPLSSLPHLRQLFAAGWVPSPERQFEAGVSAILQGWSFPDGVPA